MGSYWRDYRAAGQVYTNFDYVCLELHHGGHFVDVGNKMFKYEGGDIHWAETIDKKHIKWAELNFHAWRLGYRQPPVCYWYRNPQKSVYFPIRTDKEAKDMLNVLPASTIIEVYLVGGGERQIELAENESYSDRQIELAYIPHAQFIPQMDMVPLKAAKIIIEENVVEIYDDEEGGENQDVDEEENVADDNFRDSDYEQNPGDDVNVDDGTDGRKYATNFEVEHHFEEFELLESVGEISDDTENSDELMEGSSSSESDCEGGTSKIKRRKVRGRHFIPERDMKNPHFEVGQQFDNAEIFKEAVQQYSVLNKANLYFKTNTRKYVVVICGPKPKGKCKKKDRTCPFWLSASVNDDVSSVLTVKACNLEHYMCPLLPRVHMCNSTYLAKTYKKKWKSDPNMSRKVFQEIVHGDLGQNITVKQYWRARRLAMKMNEGSEAFQYNLLKSYGEILKETNKDTTVNLVTEMEGEVRKFKRFYVCFDACRRGFLEGCRKVIGLDGCFIKGQYTGQILSAVGIDANNGMFPICYAIVEIENKETWLWFVQHLIDDLDITNGGNYAFISDKQKGILDAVKELLPDAEHRHCVRHLYNNLKKKFRDPPLKNLVWAAARDTTVSWFDEHYATIKKDFKDAYDYLEKHDKPCHWSRAHFRDYIKCDLLLNNLCEAFNASILDARDKPILGILERLRVNLMVRLNNRRCAGLKWKLNVGPRIYKLLEKITKRSYEYIATQSSEYVFEVNGTELQSRHSVDLANMTCTCLRWRLNGLPCPHAVACMFVKKQNPVSYVDNFYSKEMYQKAYAYAINPVPGMDLWKHYDHPIQPPPFRRQPGRPPKLRRREEDEAIPGSVRASKGSVGTAATSLNSNPNKLSRTTYIQSKCTMCKDPSHNKRTCPLNGSKSAGLKKSPHPPSHIIASNAASSANSSGSTRKLSQAANHSSSQPHPIVPANTATSNVQVSSSRPSISVPSSQPSISAVQNCSHMLMMDQKYGKHPRVKLPNNKAKNSKVWKY